MIDITRFNVRFNNKKNIIIKTLIDYYGIEYAKAIKERVSNLIVDFSSMPDAEFNFLIFYNKLLNDRSKEIIKSRYKKYHNISQNLKEKYFGAFLIFIRQTLKCENLDTKVLDLFTTSDFGAGLIDTIADGLTLIGKSETLDYIRDDLSEDVALLEKFLARYNLGNISADQADRIIEFRNWIAFQYKRELIEETGIYDKMIKKIYEEFPSSYSQALNSIVDIAFLNNPTTGRLKCYKDDNIYNMYPYIKMPMLLCLSKNLKGTDCDLVHELIHVVETDGDTTGIFQHNNHNSLIVNEIRTELLAEKLTRELHKKGIFIFDDPRDYIIGRSAYSLYFPYVKEFFNKYEDKFTECAINTNPEDLRDCFGDAWDAFCIELTNSFDAFLYFYRKNMEIGTFEINKERIEELINEMEEYNQVQKIFRIIK